jgi:1-acyl-sn-glycerol-3-phosphate acyltransferase
MRAVWALRSALFVLWMTLTVIPWALFALVLSIFIRAVLLVKHQSAWETFTMPAIMPHPLAYVFKKELLYVPFFGWAMGRLDMIHIDRSQRTAAFNKVVQQGKRLMDQGVWVIMFPEGTRIPRGERASTDRRRAPGHRMRRAGDPDRRHQAKCWPRKAFVKKPGIVDISIGPAIPSGPQARRADARGRGLDRGRDARLDPEAYPDPAARPACHRRPVAQRARHPARRAAAHAAPGPAAAASQDQIRELVQTWLQRQARRVFDERCAHFAPKLGVRVKRLSAELGRHPLGQCQRRRLGAPELAADSLRAAGDRLRGHPRTGAPARDEPQPGLLGGGAFGDARAPWLTGTLCRSAVFNAKQGEPARRPSGRPASQRCNGGGPSVPTAVFPGAGHGLH